MFRKGRAASLWIAGLGVLACAGCHDGDDGPPWPGDYSAVFTKFITDPADDFEFRSGCPPTIIPYPPIDVTQVSLGMQGDFLYVRVDFAGTIPTAPVHYAEDPPVEEQTVVDQQTNVLMNSDGDTTTGSSVEGVTGGDVMFGIRFGYGRGHAVWVSCGFTGGLEGDTINIDGELGEGGPGSDYVIARYDVSKLGSYFVRGTDAQVGGWSESSSEDTSGNELYHHFAFDQLGPTTWTLPE